MNELIKYIFDCNKNDNDDIEMKQIDKQICIEGKYIVFNQGNGIIMRNCIDGFQIEHIEFMPLGIKKKVEKAYNSITEILRKDSLWLQIDLKKLRKYEKENRFRYGKKDNKWKSIWLRIDGWNFSVGLILKFLNAMPEARLYSMNSKLFLYDGNNIGLIMACIINDPVCRYDNNDELMVYDRYSVDYKIFYKEVLWNI